MIAAIVRLAGLGGKVPVFPGLKQLHARRVQIGAPVRKDAQRAVVLLIERKGFPGGLRRHGAVEEPEYDRVDHAPAMTMEDCKEVDEILESMVCKNLFLCNRQETAFYLLMIPDTKVFHTKDRIKTRS